MNSLTTIEQKELKSVNPLVIIRIVRALHKMSSGTGYGRIQIFMREGKVTIIEGVESYKIEKEAILNNVDAT